MKINDLDSTAALSAATSDNDDFLSSLRLDQSYSDATIGVHPVLGTVPTRKPNKQDFFRVHPQYALDCFCIELKEEREMYFITPTLALLVAEFCEPVRLRLCVTRLGTAFLWPIKLHARIAAPMNGADPLQKLPTSQNLNGYGLPPTCTSARTRHSRQLPISVSLSGRPSPGRK